jgi:hypothetical protein
MPMRLSGVIFLLFVGLWGQAQNRFTISGEVLDAESQETLIGVTLLVPELNTGTVTNAYGFYSLTLPEGEYSLVVQYLGYKTQMLSLSINQGSKLDIRLEIASETLEEVVVTDDIERINIKKPEMSINRLSASTIQQTPVVFGEPDVLKTIQLLPGVTSAGEGASGFNVRGGAADQNLILLDEASIYNSSHLFGFFSVFNPDAIKDLRLYKGGIPAKYGGRVSSVLDIYQKEGNKEDFKLNGGIGLVASRLLVEGPIGKGSFLVGGRGTYAHLFLKATDNPNSAYFYDLNTKISFPVNKNNKIFLSGYFGRDVFDVDGSFVNTYGNAVFNLRWNHLFSDRLFSNLSLIYSDYYYGLLLDFAGFDWNSGIQNTNLKYDFSYFANAKIKMDFGLQSTYYSFNPGYIEPARPDSGILKEQLVKKYAAEHALYVDVSHNFTDQLALQYGFRLNHYMRLGQEALNTYENNQPTIYNSNLGLYQKGIVSGTFDSGKSSATYTHLEPRLTLSYAFDNSAVKLSYNRLNQYLHLISNTSSPTPLDVWAPSGPHLKPQQLDQWAAGYFTSYENGIDVQIESFYKNVSNRLDYIDGADLVANDAVEQVTLPGRVRAYGAEILLKKSSGRLKSWLAYTWSKSEQQTKGLGMGDPGINQGAWYANAYDKRHDLSINASYTLNSKWSFNANLIYQSGQPTTYPDGQYTFAGLRVPNYGLRNGSRLPDYHRLDLSATLKPTPKEGKTRKSQWIFGVYNVYNRKNAAAISFRQNRETLRNEAVRFSIFGIVPSVTYRIDW